MGPLPGTAGPRRAHFPRRRCAATGSGSAWKGSGAKVARGFGSELYSALSPGPRRFPGPWTWYSLRLPFPLASVSSGRGPLPPPARLFDRGGLSSVRSNRVASPGRGSAHAHRRKGSAAMSATHPTRLETRTKESNARASQRARLLETPWRNESEGRRAPAEVGSRPRGAPGAPPARLARTVGEVERERVR